MEAIGGPASVYNILCVIRQMLPPVVPGRAVHH